MSAARRRRVPRSSLPGRPQNGRLLGGVCTGLSTWLGIDVTLVRLAFLVLSAAWGIGLLLYLVMWLLMANEGEKIAGTFREFVTQRAASTQTDVASSGRRLREAWHQVDRRPWPLPLGRRWMALGLLAFGAGVLLASLGAFGWLTPLRAVGLATIVVGAGILVDLRPPKE